MKPCHGPPVKDPIIIEDNKYTMIDLWILSLIYLILHFLRVLRKAFTMVLTSPSPSSPSIPWMGFGSPVFTPKGVVFASENNPIENSGHGVCSFNNSCSDSTASMSKSLVLTSEGYPLEKLYSMKYPQENSHFGQRDIVPKDKLRSGEASEEYLQENFGYDKCPEEKSNIMLSEGLNPLVFGKGEMAKLPIKLRKRPAKISIPESCPRSIFNEVGEDLGEKEVEVEGESFCLASKRGRRQVMEDGYGVITDIFGDPNQAFFGVFDGHGGRAAVDHVAEKLGKNIIEAVGEVDKEEKHLEEAIRASYLKTDKEFLSRGVSSGACAATVLLKDGELHAANVGDCRVVLSRNGVAHALTRDHRMERDDERVRIENSGGYVTCRNGVWRVQGSLAVSRAIGDLHMKDWIISNPETNKIQLTPDCKFLIMASDGLWDKVTNQEAVDVVLRHKKSIESCKKLVDISCSRGNKDDITVMIVDLQKYVQVGITKIK